MCWVPGSLLCGRTAAARLAEKAGGQLGTARGVKGSGKDMLA